jgi:hypothetical protein
MWKSAVRNDYLIINRCDISDADYSCFLAQAKNKNSNNVIAPNGDVLVKKSIATRFPNYAVTIFSTPLTITIDGVVFLVNAALRPPWIIP